jgi:cell division protein FtsQ
VSLLARESAPPQNRRRTTPTPRKRGRKVLGFLGRWGRRAAELCVLLAAIIGLVVLGRWTHQYVTTSPYFAAQEAAVRGNERVPPGVIQHMSGLTPGTNIFAVSTAEAARRIMEHPWIASAEVHRRLPSQISITVVERRAVAILSVGTMYLIDDQGSVFTRVGPGDPVDLPMITGVDRDRYEEERPAARADLMEALALIQLYEESGLGGRWPLSEVHFEQDGTLSIYAGDEATHIRLGRPPFRRKLRRLARLFRDLRSRQAVADYVYLEEADDHVLPDRAVVRLRSN